MKLFREAEIRKMLGWVTAEQISFSRMVEMINEKAERKLKKQNQEPVLVDGVPRRARLDLNTQAELAITFAVDKVEKSGCDPVLTEIINKLHDIKEELSDWIERQPVEMTENQKRFAALQPEIEKYHLTNSRMNNQLARNHAAEPNNLK